MEGTRRHREEEGFTLIELMTVVLIIAILMTIGLPVWFAARQRAADRAGQSLVMEGHRALLVSLADAKDLSTITLADLNAVEPAIRFLGPAVGAESRQEQLSVTIGNDGTYDYAIISTHATGSNGCIAVREREGAGTDFARLTGTSTCPAVAFGPASAWGPEWSKVT